MVSVSVILQRARLPTAEAWQRTIDELGLPLQLDPGVASATSEGMWPVTFKGRETGFEYFIDRDPGPFEGSPDSNTAADEIRVILVSRSKVESRAAVAAAAALAAVSQGRVHDDADQRFYDRDEAVQWARQLVAEGDTMDAAPHQTAARPSWPARIRQAAMNRLDPPSVVAEWAADDLMVIKVSTSQLELNIYVPRSELGEIERVQLTNGRVRIGTILGAPAWWCIGRDEDVLFIVGGQDDETWDVGATLPRATVEAIRAEVDAALARG